jgi:hypothetical protein
MTNKRIAPMLFVLGLLVGGSLPPAAAGEVPPTGSTSLAAVLKSVEEQKAGVVTKAEFDDGMWEVRVCEIGACQKVYLDPRSGEVKRRRKTEADEMPPAGAMPLSTIVQSVEARGLGSITEVEFDTGFWEVELHRDGRRTKLVIDPRTGDARR